tara:strand:+ start:3690 stop:4202 length:513 start_codon:yes stop_codon:yes gene_type:complete
MLIPRFALDVVFPTPPFPDVTTITCASPSPVGAPSLAPARVVVAARLAPARLTVGVAALLAHVTRAAHAISLERPSSTRARRNHATVRWIESNQMANDAPRSRRVRALVARAVGSSRRRETSRRWKTTAGLDRARPWTSVAVCGARASVIVICRRSDAMICRISRMRGSW